MKMPSWGTIKKLLERALKALKDSPIEIAEDIHYEGEYVNSRYTRFYIERDVENLDDALDDEKLKS